jgi:RHS repeat-associated protein
VRVKFAMVDTAGVDDGVRFVDSGSAELSGQRIGGVHRGPVWSDWIDVPEGDGRVVAALEPGAGGHEATTGASMESLQFRVRGAGAGQAWPPIRFPGQYADAETGLNENWHRYYEPSTGRYAQAEPVLSAPTTVMATTSSGLGWSAYGYATNNPVGLGDPNGMLPMDSPGWDRVATANLKIVAAAQAGDKPSQYFVAAAVGLFAGVNFYALSWLVPEMLAGGAAGASVAVADAMKLPAAAPGTDTIVLGQYASRVAGGIFPAKERLLQPLADAVRGRLLDQLAGEIEVLTPHIRAADRILFCVKDKMGPLTMAEYQLIKSSPELLMKTIFVTGGYPPK